MGGSDPIRVMLADDHLVFRFGLASIIGRQPDMCVVAEAWSGPSAIELYRAHRPDVTLMDLRMPGEADTETGGLEAIATICAEDPAARILVVTIHDGRTAARALEQGARGFVPKDSPCEDVLTAIRSLSSSDVGGSPKTCYAESLPGRSQTRFRASLHKASR